MQRKALIIVYCSPGRLQAMLQAPRVLTHMNTTRHKHTHSDNAVTKLYSLFKHQSQNIVYIQNLYTALVRVWPALAPAHMAPAAPGPPHVAPP